MLYISNQWSSRLINVLGGLTIVGLERSAKFTHRSLNSDRYIVGPQHTTFTADRLTAILTELHFPDQHLSDVLEWFGKSNQSGLGFEQDNGISTYRLYLEFFDRYKPDPLLNQGLLHIGYKWLCSDPQKMTITRYFFAPSFDGDNVENVVRTALMMISKQFTDDVISAILKSVADIPAKERIISYASDDSGCRRSFTVKVYKSKKKLSFIKPELERIAGFFHIEQNILDRFIADAGDATIGHFAGGLNSVNDPFFTIYFDDFYQMMKNEKVL